MQRLGAASFTMLPAAAPVQTRGYPGARLSVWERDWTATGLADPSLPRGSGDARERDWTVTSLPHKTTVLCPQNMAPPPLITDISTLVAQERKKLIEGTRQ